MSLHAVIGLGNPGSKYERTRHNVGWRVVQQLAQEVGAADWQTKFDCKFAKAALGDLKLLLILPQKFMNLSGEAAAPLLRFFQVPPENVTAVHDELDLAQGVLRIKRGGGSGGHRGIDDLTRHLGSDDFFRVRVGIGHPRDVQSPMDVSDWVLTEPAGEDAKIATAAEKEAVAATQELIRHGIERAQLKFHSKP